MASFASTAEFLARVDSRFLDQLAAPDMGAPDEVRIGAALDDATAELEGWLGRLPAERRPAAETLRLHAIKVALYLLTLNRPAADFEQIRDAYTDTIEFYRSMIAEAAEDAGASGIGGSAEKPCPVFNDDTLKGFV